MATKSILKNIIITDRSACKKLISALKHSAKNPRPDVVIKKRCVSVKDPETIQKMFGSIRTIR